MKQTKNQRRIPSVLLIFAAVIILVAGLFCLVSGMSRTMESKTESAVVSTEEASLDTSNSAVRPVTEEEKAELAQSSQIENAGAGLNNGGLSNGERNTYLTRFIGGERLQSGIADVLTSFLDEYYHSQRSFPDFFKSLEQVEVPDMTSWFAEPEGLQASLWQNALTYLCAAKTLNINDLSWTDCAYKLTLEEVSMEDNQVAVTVSESAEVYFAHLNGLKSEQNGVKCKVIFTKQGDSWKIVSYYREEDFFLAIYNYMDENTTAEDIPELRMNALRRFCGNYLEMMTDKEAYLAGKAVYYVAPNAYDRQAAGAYAALYSLDRNSNWPNYDELGGNGQNFASQVLYAGGIPMDLVGEATWKYYDATVDESSEETGRTPSWISAYYFHSYALCNSGRGLASVVGANCFAADTGDIFQSGANRGEIDRTSVVQEAFSDEDGQLIDILLCANSPDRINWPMTATFDAEISLVKIQGWLDE